MPSKQREEKRREAIKRTTGRLNGQNIQSVKMTIGGNTVASWPTVEEQTIVAENRGHPGISDWGHPGVWIAIGDEEGDYNARQQHQANLNAYEQYWENLIGQQEEDYFDAYKKAWDNFRRKQEENKKSLVKLQEQVDNFKQQMSDSNYLEICNDLKRIYDDISHSI